jgi:DNA-binding IclR family transcriptional regulator
MPRKAKTESVADLNAAEGGVAAVDRALTLLKCFSAGDGPLSLGDFAERSGLYKSTILRLLSSLENADFLQRLDDGRYALSAEVARLHALYAASFSLDRVVEPVLARLVRQTGESAAYHVLQGQSRLCLYRVDSPHPVRDHIKAGDVLPADKGTGARVLQAFSASPVAGSPKDRKLFAEIRARGYYSANGDRLADVAGISAPVFRADGTLAAALTLTMPSHRYDEKHVAHVLASARALSGKV